MTILKVENLSKQYRLGTIGTGTLSHDLNRWWADIRGKEDPYLKVGDVNDRSTKATSDYVWALRDINFEVQKGEVLGIIGKNGAGKSTLLKILSKITAPTTGSVKFNGRIASLLEVGTGFHGEMTGRENIFLNGAILGMTKAEITAKLEEIIEFSGCERYIDTPVKRYSSGMTVRLAFAVAAFLEPDILVIDEVLAVGDAEFQKKAIGKMQDISRGQGRTVLFVSHNMAAVKQLCTRGILLENGGIVFEGNIDECVEFYTSFSYSNLKNESVHFDNLNKISILETKISQKDRILNNNNLILLGDKLKIGIKIKANENLNDLSIAMDIHNINSEFIAHITNEDDNVFFKNILKGQFIELNIETNEILFVPGTYIVDLWIGSGQIDTFYKIKNLFNFNIEQSNYTKRTKPIPKFSKIYLHTTWSSIIS